MPRPFRLPVAALRPFALLIAGAALAQEASDEAAAEALGAGIGFFLGIIIAIVTGAIIGWIASLLVQGSGSGLWTNVLIGIGGSLLASLLLPALGIGAQSVLGSLLAAVLGAVVLLLIVRMIRRT